VLPAKASESEHLQGLIITSGTNIYPHAIEEVAVQR
jgi:acyl-CoA synthetase (AMP-forming)/AMP-acid ligase II